MTRRAGVVGAAVALGLALASPPAHGAGFPDDPVRLTVGAPAIVAVQTPFAVTVAVSSDPAAFDTTHGPVRLRVRLSVSGCRDTFATTPGPVAIDARLALPPRPSPLFSARLSGQASAADFGTATICAFVEEEGSDRLYALDTETQVTVSRPCTVATRRESEAAAALAGARAALARTRSVLARARGRALSRHARRRSRARLRRLRRRAARAQRRVLSLEASWHSARQAVARDCSA